MALSMELWHSDTHTHTAHGGYGLDHPNFDRYVGIAKNCIAR